MKIETYVLFVVLSIAAGSAIHYNLPSTKSARQTGLVLKILSKEPLEQLRQHAIDGTPVDGYGTAIRIREEESTLGAKFLLTSAGPDRNFGTADDVAVTCQRHVSGSISSKTGEAVGEKGVSFIKAA